MVKVKFNFSENLAYEAYYDTVETVDDAIDIINEALKDGWIYGETTMLSFEHIKFIEFEVIE